MAAPVIVVVMMMANNDCHLRIRGRGKRNSQSQHRESSK